MELKPLSLTHVVYAADDPVAYCLAIVTLAPIFVCVFYASVLAVRRDSHVLFMMVGQALNLALNYGLKKAIDEPRPGIIVKHEGEGMPSNHAQFICFFCTFLLLGLRWPKRAAWEVCCTAAGLVLLAALVAMSRVYLGYHTVEQVAVGAIVGTAAAWLWSLVYVLRGKEFMTRFCSSPVGVWLLMRDFSNCEYSVVEEYEAWRQHRRIADKLA